MESTVPATSLNGVTIESLAVSIADLIPRLCQKGTRLCGCARKALGVTKESTDIADEIRSIIARVGRLPVEIATIGNDEDLFHKGMTSTASVSVMLALQVHFGFEFPDSMLRRSTFESVAAMQAAVVELLGATPVQ